MARKLASIQRIKALTPIPGADRIETATVQGWQVVVKKGEYAVGDLVIYVEIDAWVPNKVAPFLTGEGKEPKEYNGVKGERLKTIKLRKQISQGLVLPCNVLAPTYDEGTDVTEALGIQKWEAAEERQSNNGTYAQAAKTRAFPFFLRKTDQERIQNYAHLIEKELDTEFEVTVKKDGSSCTVFRVDPSSEYYADAKKMLEGKPSLWQRLKQFVLREKAQPVFGICSRNVLLKLEGDSNFHKATRGVLAALDDERIDNGSWAVQGEVVAPDIQGNYEKVKDVEFHIFDTFSIDTQRYSTPRARQEWIAETGLTHATVVDKGTLRNIIQYKEGDDIVAKLLTYASGEGDNPGVQREGVVFKAMDKDFSFKAVSNEYLLATGK
jgi:RNA ligase (TIGR02306 family)